MIVVIGLYLYLGHYVGVGLGLGRDLVFNLGLSLHEGLEIKLRIKGILCQYYMDVVSKYSKH